MPASDSNDDHAVKQASPDHDVHALIAGRWSPYGFSELPVPDEEVRSLFEAARWAPSSYNEQPWSYILATQADRSGFERLISCLVEANQAWAQAAPVVAIGITRMEFARSGKANPAAAHDLGLAAGNLCLEATARGLCVHQMIGILPERARELYSIPAHSDAVTALAIGYAADPHTLAENYRERDLRSRKRKPLSEFVFAGQWGESAEIAS